MAEELFVKPVRALTWSGVGSDAAIIERIAAGDEDACAELVDEHQRFVYQLDFQQRKAISVCDTCRGCTAGRYLAGHHHP